MSEETTRRGRGNTATVDPPAQPETPPAATPEAPPPTPQQGTPPEEAEGTKTEEAPPAEEAAEEVKEPTPEEIDTQLAEVEEEALNTLTESIAAAREVTLGQDPEGKSYGTALLEGIKTFLQAVKDSILQPLQSRGTTAEVNIRTLRNSDEYQRELRLYRKYKDPDANQLPEEDEKEIITELANKAGSGIIQETDENRNQTVPLSPPSFSFHYSAGTPTAGAATPARTRAENGEATARKYKNLRDTLDNSETNIWNMLWKGFSEANKAACEKAAREKPSAFPAGKGGNRVPTLGYNNKGLPSGRMLLDWMIDLRLPEVKGMRKGEFLPSLMPWGRQQKIKDKDGNIKPRYILVNQDGSEEPFV